MECSDGNAYLLVQGCEWVGAIPLTPQWTSGEGVTFSSNGSNVRENGGREKGKAVER